MRRLAFLVGALGAAACVDVPPPSCEDFDEDGWSCATSAPDCDETSRDIHPGANEICENGADEDCDGRDLENCEEALPGLTVFDDNQDVEVTGRDVGEIADAWRVTIERDYGFAITSLQQAGEEMLLGGTDELRGVGVELSPADAQWKTGDGQLHDLANGVAVVHRWARWEIDEGFGFSYVTIFPDGRIHRHDRVELATAVDATRFSTYASFSHAFDVVTWPGLSAPLPVSLPLRREGAIGEAGWMCALDTGSANRAALLWVVDPAQPAAPTIDAVAGRLTLSYDWLRDVTSVPAGEYGATTMLLANTTVSVASAACAFDEIAAQLTAPAPLLIHAGRASDSDDVAGDGYDADAGFYRVAADGADHVEIELGAGGAPGPGVVVRIDTPAPGVTVWRDGVRLEAGRDYLFQIDLYYDDAIYLYLRGPLAAGARFWIAAPGGEP